MSRTKISFALITIVLVLAHPSPAGAEDPIESAVLVPPPLSFRSAEIPVEQWRWAGVGPVQETVFAGTSEPWRNQVPGQPHFLAALLPGSILDRPGKRDSSFMDTPQESMLTGEPEDTAFVLGFRYTFSEFDLGDFCKSLFNLVARGNRPPDREEPGFTFYVDSPSR